MTHIVIPNWLISLATVLTTINLVLAVISVVLRRRELELERQKAETTALRRVALRDLVGRP